MSSESTELIRERLITSGRIKEQMANDDQLVNLIEKIVNQILKAFKTRKKVIICGNGGSAADAQHIAAELAGRFYLDRQGLPAIALVVNTSTLTALSNDYSFSEVFSRQLEGLGRPGDIVIAISTSGNSENVLKAVNQAKEMQLITVGFTGKDGGKLKDLVDYCVQIPSNDTPRIQEGHITVGHIICELVEKELFGSKA